MAYKEPSNKAKLAKLKEDILGDGLKKSKLESFTKLKLKEFSEKSKANLGIIAETDPLDISNFERAKAWKNVNVFSVLSDIVEELPLPSSVNTLLSIENYLDPQEMNLIFGCIALKDTLNGVLLKKSTPFTVFILFVFKLLKELSSNENVPTNIKDAAAVMRNYAVLGLDIDTYYKFSEESILSLDLVDTWRFAYLELSSSDTIKLTVKYGDQDVVYYLEKGKYVISTTDKKLYNIETKEEISGQNV